MQPGMDLDRTTLCSRKTSQEICAPMVSKGYPFTFHPEKKGLRKILGDLEADVMDIVWSAPAVTVREVHRKLENRREVAYTTVMTVMSRLAEKGLLDKVKEGAVLVYRARCTREEFTQSTVGRVVRELIDDFAAPTISQFVDSMDDEDPETIDELARLIERKRKAKP